MCALAVEISPMAAVSRMAEVGYMLTWLQSCLDDFVPDEAMM